MKEADLDSKDDIDPEDLLVVAYVVVEGGSSGRSEVLLLDL